MGVDKFLDTLSEEGSRDSEGEFTIALEKAALKLAEFRLAKREQFALHLLQVAVLSGAERFFVTTEDDGRLCFFFDGEPMVHADLVDAVEHRTKGVSPRIRQLQIVLSAVHSDEDTLFSVHGPDFSQTLVLNNGKLDFLPHASHTNKGCFLSTYWREPSEVLKGLRELGCYSPLELRVKGKSPNKPLDFGFQERDVHAVLEVKGLETVATADPALSSRKVLAQERSDPESPFFYFALTGEDSKSTFHHISNGVILGNEEVPFDFPMISGAATVSHLPKDLSQSQLARKSEYAEFERALQKHLTDFLVSYCESGPKLPVALQRSFCIELRRFFGTKCPEAILVYLASTESIEFIKGKSKLKRFRRKFADEAGGLKIRRLIQLYEERAFEFWKELKITGLTELMNDYRYLLSDPGPIERGTLDCCKFLTEGSTQDDWSERLDPDKPDHHQFRAFLMAKESSAESSIESYVENPFWKNLYKFFLTDWPEMSFGGDDLLAQLHRLRSGDYSRVLALCKLIEADPRTKKLTPYWFRAIYLLVRGKIGWIQQIKMTVRFNSSSLPFEEFPWVQSAIDSDLAVRTRWQLKDLGYSHRGKTFLNLYFWSFPLNQTSQYKLVARQALLWESFYTVDARLHFDQSLPDKPFE